jgi:hypothetical protein
MASRAVRALSYCSSAPRRRGAPVSACHTGSSRSGAGAAPPASACAKATQAGSVSSTAWAAAPSSGGLVSVGAVQQ